MRFCTSFETAVGLQTQSCVAYGQSLVLLGALPELHWHRGLSVSKIGETRFGLQSDFPGDFPR